MNWGLAAVVLAGLLLMIVLELRRIRRAKTRSATPEGLDEPGPVTLVDDDTPLPPGKTIGDGRVKRTMWD